MVKRTIFYNSILANIVEKIEGGIGKWEKKRPFIAMILLICIFSMIEPTSKAVTTETSNQIFTKNLSKELNSYIKKNGGDIALEYQDLITGEMY